MVLLQRKPTGPVLLLEDDPNNIYVEETAFLYHDPPSTNQGYEETRKTLIPLPPPPLPPQIPMEKLSAKWILEEESRVLLADFSHLRDIPDSDKDFLMMMMQRDVSRPSRARGTRAGAPQSSRAARGEYNSLDVAAHSTCGH